MKSAKAVISEGLKSMKNPPKKKEHEKIETTCCEPMEEKYPWGLRIDLNDKSMKKLGMKAADFSVGDSVTCVIKCKIKSVSSRETEHDKGMKEDVELQITDMKLETED